MNKSKRLTEKKGHVIGQQCPNIHNDDKMRQKDIQKNIREQITQPEKGQRNVNNNKQ